MRRVILVACALPLLVGCVSTVSEPLHLTARANFEPGKRRVVWGRALTSFQIADVFVVMSDSVGGVLQSGPQPTWTRCNNTSASSTSSGPGAMFPARDENRHKTEGAMCRSTINVQFTITDDGLAFLRVNRGVTGEVATGKSLFTEGDLKALQSDCDEWLHFITGEASSPPESLRRVAPTGPAGDSI